MTQSFFTIFRVMLGVGNTSQYYAVDQIVYVVWTLMFTLYIFYLILPVSIALLLESFDDVTMELGHVTDYASSQEKGRFFKWIINLRPW